MIPSPQNSPNSSAFLSNFSSLKPKNKLSALLSNSDSKAHNLGKIHFIESDVAAPVDRNIKLIDIKVLNEKTDLESLIQKIAKEKCLAILEGKESKKEVKVDPTQIEKFKYVDLEKIHFIDNVLGNRNIDHTEALDGNPERLTQKEKRSVLQKEEIKKGVKADPTQVEKLNHVDLGKIFHFENVNALKDRNIKQTRVLDKRRVI